MKKDKLRKQSLLWHELDLLSEKMALAMRTAHIPYVAEREAMTPMMEEIWGQYCDWARRAEKAGM